MAIPWLVVLQSVPWTQVISNAPKVAEGAKRLWNTVSRQSPAQEMTSRHSGQPPDSPSIATLEERLAAMEIAIDELHEQMLASSELIKTMAEQNTQLVKRIEENRVRMVWLAAVVGILAVLCLTLLFIR